MVWQDGAIVESYFGGYGVLFRRLTQYNIGNGKIKAYKKCAYHKLSVPKNSAFYRLTGSIINYVKEDATPCLVPFLISTRSLSDEPGGINSYFFAIFSSNQNLKYLYRPIVLLNSIVMSFNTIQTSIEEKAAFIRLNRPDALNALNTELFNEINRFLDDNPPENSYGVLVITGNGKAFAAGADIAEMVNKNSEEAAVYSRLGQNTFSRIENLEIPVIASVNGYALGGGCELSMSAHMRIASTKARFGQPEVNLGLIPGFAATQRLPRLVGRSNALYLLLSADMIGAEEALRMGLVQKVVEHEQLGEETKKLAQAILAKGPAAIKSILKVIKETENRSLEEGAGIETEYFSSLFGGEGTEGMKAFLEKRDPTW